MLGLWCFRGGEMGTREEIFFEGKENLIEGFERNVSTNPGKEERENCVKIV